ncbi:hypothetical protein [Clostridium ljungdahlii]|uniref:Uncharacterized protein n=1 Tax=Clostridium ljungdahlii TaxID=1538 RepID=A0A166RKW8_9CLOT|nr:hypothetical protein [Clostridium ljungdahlii]OAA90887.1 hypothetical protein WY13_00953 [Clostridium ljungdahlii]
MGLAKKGTLKVVSPRGSELEKALFNQFNIFHSRDCFPIKEVEKIILKERQHDVYLMDNKPKRPPENLLIFSPSGASKCNRELIFNANKEKKIEERYPYQRRWTRNSTAVHEVTQSDLLYMTHLMKKPDFKVKFLENGLPAWEKNLKTYKVFKHNGVEFSILGMMDGILTYKDGTDIGFEFKTKTNSVAQVGNYKMKEPALYHKQQCVCYSLLFGMDEFVLMYEAVAKDGWNKNGEARTDIRTFYYKVDEKDRTLLLDKYAQVVKDFEAMK